MWFLYALPFAFLSSVGTIIAKIVMEDMDEYSYLLMLLGVILLVVK